jgi:hypothetical protein
MYLLAALSLCALLIFILGKVAFDFGRRLTALERRLDDLKNRER